MLDAVDDEVDTTCNEAPTYDYIVTFAASSVPEVGTWRMPTLYKNNMYWDIGWNGERIVIVYGFIDGAQQVKTRAVHENSSSRNLSQQAHLEIRQRFSKMLRKGYALSLNDPVLFQPMLAAKYEATKRMKFPVYVQPKLDGVRALSHYKADGVELYSREGLKWPWLDTIKSQLVELFKYLPTPTVLDGELYSPELTFNQMISAVRTTTTRSHLNDKMRYYLFDAIITEQQNTYDYLTRYLILEGAMQSALDDGVDLSYIELLPVQVARSHEDIKAAHDDYVSQGYEGAIIRKSLESGEPIARCIYKCSRCVNLLKVKSFSDEEGIVIDVTSGEGSEEGLAMFRIRANSGVEFFLRPRGSFEARREWYLHPDIVLGRPYTYRYFELTEYGVPRFPVGVGFRDYERS